MLTTSQVVSKNFVCFLGRAILKNKSFVLIGQDHTHSMLDFQSKTICSQLIILGVVLERNLLESSFSEAFGKTGEVVNNVLT